MIVFVQFNQCVLFLIAVSTAVVAINLTLEKIISNDIRLVDTISGLYILHYSIGAGLNYSLLFIFHECEPSVEWEMMSRTNKGEKGWKEKKDKSD